jgi:hypothetical protein
MVIGLSLGRYALFVATLGRGLYLNTAASPAPIRRDGMVIGLSLGRYALFVATLGRGLYF